jgi:glutathione-regulated potassium-efflux system ancillary protein KefG
MTAARGRIAPMNILILHAHPRSGASVVQRAMLRAVAGLEAVTLVDLYAEYPSLDIDVAREQQRLLAHDLIVLQHPFYWYSSPAIIKEWQDLVLENGWAYGPGGTRLAGRFLMSAISTGGSEAAYHHEGRNRFEIAELLSPFNQTAWLCSMAWLTPFVIHSGRRMAGPDLSAAAEAYRDLIVGLRDGRIDPLSRLAPGYRLPPAFHEKAL